MNFYQIYKKLKPAPAQRGIVVSPGRIWAPALGLWGHVDTGSLAGAWAVRLAGPLPPGTRFDAGEREGTIRALLASGAVVALDAEEAAEPEEAPTGGSPAVIPHKKTLAWVASVASKDQSRDNLRGVLFRGTSCVATDGHRLHEARITPVHDEDVMIASEHIALLGDASAWLVEKTSSVLRFESGAVLRMPHMYAESFPQYERLFPDLAKAHRATVPGEALFAAHRDAAKIASSRGVVWEPREEALAVSIQEAALSWARDVPGLSGDLPKVSFNPRYIADVVKGTKADVAVALTDTTSAAVFGLPGLPGSTKRRALVMPIRV